MMIESSGTLELGVRTIYMNHAQSVSAKACITAKLQFPCQGQPVASFAATKLPAESGLANAIAAPQIMDTVSKYLYMCLILRISINEVLTFSAVALKKTAS